MENENAPHMVHLGFTDEHFPVGTHICQLYSDENEREEALLKFVAEGIRSGEKTACFTDNSSSEKVLNYIEEYVPQLGAKIIDNNLVMSGAREVYFKDDRFEPERMLSMLESFHKHAHDCGCSAARVIGEMDPDIQKIKGGERLYEYEALVGLLLKKYPVTAICQYNVNDYSGMEIMNVMKVHPLMIVSGAVVRNPFYVEPQIFLERFVHGSH